MGNDLQLQFLGPPCVSRDGDTLAGFVSAKATALLAYLAITGEAHSREVLATLFWGDTPEEHARASLRVVLANLRQVVGHEYFETSRVSIAFRNDHTSWLDVDAFESLIHAGTLETLNEAVELYRGDLLSGVSLHGALVFDEWLAARREHLRQLVINARDKLANHAIEQADLSGGIEHLHQLLDIEPWREDAHRRLMHLLVRAGRRNAALLHYEQCRRFLMEELGVEPEPDTTGLYERIARGELSADTTPPDLKPTVPATRQTVRAPHTSFIGREAEIDHAVACLNKPDCRLLTLVGQGGVGKTRLALQVAADQRLDFRDGVHVVPLASVRDADGVAAAIAAAIGMQSMSAGEPADQVLGYLHNRHTLLVLDNMEHLLDGVPFLESILAVSPNTTLLVTSRERLALRAEWLLPIQGLQSDDGAGQHVPDSPAMRLFVDRVLQVQPQFELNDENRALAYRICTILGGLPLGIELAASWSRTHDVSEIVARIEESLDFLNVFMRDVPERHQSLRAAFRHSWNLLDERTRTLYSSLSVFHGGFTSVAAREVVGASESDLLGIVDKSLLYRDASGRYALHQAIRQYALEELEASSSMEQVLGRFATYFAGFLQQQVAPLKGTERAAGLDRIGADLDNVRFAWEWMIANHAIELISRSLDGLQMYFELSMQFSEGRRRVEQARAMLDNLDPADDGDDRETRILHGRLLGWMARLAFSRGEFNDAARFIERGVHLVGEGAAQQIAYCLTTHGTIVNDTGEPDLSLRLQQAALREATEAGDKDVMALALEGLAGIASTRGQFRDAHMWFSRCIALRGQLTHWDNYALQLSRIGEIARLLGNFEEARRRQEDCMAVQNERETLYYAHMPYQSLAWLCIDEGRFAEAEQHVTRLRAFVQEVGLRRAAVLEMLASAELLRFTNDLEAARALQDGALELAQSAGYTTGYLRGLVAQAELFFAMEEWQQSHKLARLARDKAVESSSLYNVSSAELLLSRIAIVNGEHKEADTLLESAFARLEEGGARPAMLDAIASKAELLMADGNRRPERLPRAVELLAFVTHNPSARYDTRLRAQPMLEGLSDQMSPATFNESRSSGRQLRWDTLPL